MSSIFFDICGIGVCIVIAGIILYSISHFIGDSDES